MRQMSLVNEMDHCQPNPVAILAEIDLEVVVFSW